LQDERKDILTKMVYKQITMNSNKESANTKKVSSISGSMTSSSETSKVDKITCYFCSRNIYERPDTIG
jgi:hypothetical protein